MINKCIYHRRPAKDFHKIKTPKLRERIFGLDVPAGPWESIVMAGHGLILRKEVSCAAIEMSDRETLLCLLRGTEEFP